MSLLNGLIFVVRLRKPVKDEYYRADRLRLPLNLSCFTTYNFHFK